MSWERLRGLGITIRPYPNPPPSGSIPSPFEASLSATIATIGREIDQLGGTRIVLQVGYREQDLRIDGMPRANAKMEHGAVALSFDSIWGPLRYETNEFTGRYYHGQEAWHANLRAIALGMEALRKVDRYGVSKRGEQYTGYRALTTSTDPADSIQTREQAAALIDGYGGMKQALVATHPDTGGDADEFRKVMRAKEILG